MNALQKMFSCRTSDDAKSFLRHPEKQPMKIGGIVALVLVAIGVYYMMPELRRYLRIERM